MTIEEILKNAGVDDQAIIDAVKAEMPKAFLPLEEHNKRIGKAKQEAADVQAAFDTFKAETEAAAKENEGKESETAQALAALQEKFEKLQGDYTDSQNRHKQRKATDALSAALKEAGANPAALKLLAENGLHQVEYGEDGEPSNIDKVTETIKEANAGLFGEIINTGKTPAKAAGKNEPEDPFLRGFGKLD